VCGADDGDHEAVVEGDGDAEVDGAVLDDGGFGEGLLDDDSSSNGDKHHRKGDDDEPRVEPQRSYPRRTEKGDDDEGGFGEGSETPQVTKQGDDFASVGLQDPLVAGGDHGLRQLRREETTKPPEPILASR